ncbi:S1C family serine protease [Herbiconiux moechotypicola]|uniref:PDZ domain-containing protein n=1 Tax=Herbiconiux moechotypicola TaxID=637393 RepID=A0ABP5Q3X6_9MICO|nr:S1C family serine protease [Herbiconiux moechotypicola]MCS5729025.1 S1C family serine protease [Herbiconiux moechotypicola]
MTENIPPASPEQRPYVIAHTSDGPVVFMPSTPVAVAEQPPRRERRSRARRRRLAIIAGAAAAALVIGAGTGTAAFALGAQQAAAEAAAATDQGSATIVEDWGSAGPLDLGAQGGASGGYGSSTLPGSGSYGGYGGYGSGGSASGSTSGSTSTDAVAASAEQSAGVVTIVSDLTYQGAQSAGTGIVLTSDGLILTNNHVIEGSTSIAVTDELTGVEYSATVVGTDATHDIAVLQLDDADGLTTATLGDSDTVAVGDAVTAVGNAEGTGDLVAASGTVTALEQSITTQSESGIEGESLEGLIQVDADIVSGDSGGPLLNADGEVVGIDTAASSGTADITGFAIPLSDALDIVAQIEAGVDTEFIEIGYPGFLGISVAQDVATGTRGGAGSGTGTGTSSVSGATVAGVIEGTPAESAGLAAGDVITAVNGTAITSGSALSDLLGAMEPGETVTLDYTTASGTAASVTVTLMQGPAA